LEKHGLGASREPDLFKHFLDPDLELHQRYCYRLQADEEEVPTYNYLRAKSSTEGLKNQQLGIHQQSQHYFSRLQQFKGLKTQKGKTVIEQ